jgi:hypothetical protein
LRAAEQCEDERIIKSLVFAKVSEDAIAFVFGEWIARQVLRSRPRNRIEGIRHQDVVYLSRVSDHGAKTTLDDVAAGLE